MSRYGSAVYGASKYGETPRLAYSVEPVSVLPINYEQVNVYWQIPSGTYSQARLVRNQSSYPEHAEDGAIVWSEVTSAISRNFFRDGIDNTTNNPAIVPGKPIYYRMFLFTGSNVWVSAGLGYSIVASDHGIQQKFINALPRVFTSAEQSPLAEPDPNAPLNLMLNAFSYTLDEYLTHLDLLNPDHSLISTPGPLIPLEEIGRGLTIEPGLPIKNRKQLTREAIYMYTRRGTQTSLTTYVKSLTGYPSTITVSNNLMLNPQDSTFYQTTGNWTATNATLSSVTEQVPPTVTNAIDESYTCKIVASAAGSMTLGADNPILKGVPLSPGSNYVLSAQIKSPTSAGSVTAKLYYYDKNGSIIGTSTAGSAVAANNTWKSISVSKYATMYVAASLLSATGASGTVTYTTFAPHAFRVGDVVTITGFTTTAFNLTSQTITAITPTTFSVSNAATGSTTSTESGFATNGQTDADYASIEFDWSAAGTYYIDMVCVQPGTTPVYDEARAVDVFLSPNKQNLIVNPSFEVNVTDGWTNTGLATVTQDTDIPTLVYSGTKSAKIVATGAWSYTSSKMPVTQGLYYTSSLYVKTTAPFTITLTGYDNTGTPTGHTETYNFPTNAAWSRISVTDLMDAIAEANVTQYSVGISGGTGTYHIDSVQFEQSPFATDYFDGSLPLGYGAVWGGTANNSPSYIYFNKEIKVYRLGHTITDWVPIHSFWRIRSYAGLEYTNIQV